MKQLENFVGGKDSKIKEEKERNKKWVKNANMHSYFIKYNEKKESMGKNITNGCVIEKLWLLQIAISILFFSPSHFYTFAVYPYTDLPFLLLFSSSSVNDNGMA